MKPSDSSMKLVNDEESSPESCWVGTPVADTSPHQPATHVSLCGCAQKNILPHLIDSPYHCLKGVLMFWNCDKRIPANNAMTT